LVGLELRPRRLREAAAFWQKVSDAVGTEARDALWAHPDLVPSGSDIDDPTALIARLEAEARGETPEPDEFDTALEQLLQQEDSREDDSAGSEGDSGSTDERRDDPPHV
jgi:hypothetical protein